MSGHTCTRCLGLRANIRELEGAILQCLRTAENAPGTPRAKGQRVRAADLKARLAGNRADLAAHLAEVSAAT
jgi:hypothetical protein